MQLAAVVLARALAFVEVFDLNPHGKVFYPELVSALVQKFGFVKFPQKIEDFDETKGVEFLEGRCGDVTVERLTIYQNGLLLDTRVSTAESVRILTEGLNWAASTLGLSYKPEMIRHYRYVSNLTFYSKYPILSGASSPISKLGHKIQALHNELTGSTRNWEPTVLTFNSELVDQGAQFAPFTIQRRAQSAFSENKYFSEAPLPTDTHIACLEQLESDIAASES